MLDGVRVRPVGVCRPSVFTVASTPCAWAGHGVIMGECGSITDSWTCDQVQKKHVTIRRLLVDINRIIKLKDLLLFLI